MTSRILKSILSVAVAVLLASFVIITGVMYQYFENVQEAQLKDELSLAVNATEQLGEDYLETLDSGRYRLTWVDADGEVLYDSHADEGTMENHGNREEIKEALISGTGSSVRKSSTLMEKTIYEAKRLSDSTVLRISVSSATAVTLVLGMLQPLAVVLVIAIILSICLARRMAKQVVEPLNQLNLEKPLENDAYEELSPLLHRIHVQHMEIKGQKRTLKRKQDEFDQITANMKEAMVLLDKTGRILNINPAGISLFQTDILCIGKDFLTIDRQQYARQAMETAKEQGHANLRAKKNGKDYQFDFSRIDVDEKYHGMVILAFDITEQVNAENNRREFAANVSHELKTPLQAIIGSAELMENGIVKEEDAPRFVSRIRREAARLVDLIDDIIHLSQLDEGVAMPQEDISLRVIAEDVCEILSDAAKMKDVSLEVTGDDGVVHGVRRLLNETIYNLCDNGIKYNQPGGNVKIHVEEEPGKVILSVKDTGIGISHEHHDKIFERFYRVDKSHSKQSGGTGLGLSIVKHAVQYHHGTIVVESEAGQGTAFTITFHKTNEM